MADTHKLTLNGKDFELAFTMAGVKAAEEVLGRGILFIGLDQQTISSPKVADVTAFLYGATREKHSSLTLDDVEGLLSTARNIYASWSVCLTALHKSSLFPEDPEKPSETAQKKAES